jgi:hypothetical protein
MIACPESELGTLAILNVAGGDVKVSFDKSNPQETIRAKRIVRDMLHRGYALLVEVERDGEKRFERALDFNEETNEYIIADFDPITSPVQEWQRASEEGYEAGMKEGGSDGESVPEENVGQKPEAEPRPTRRGRYRKAVPASGTRAVAVARSAGG